MIYLSNLAVEVSEQYYSMHSWLYLKSVTGIWTGQVSNATGNRGARKVTDLPKAT